MCSSGRLIVVLTSFRITFVVPQYIHLALRSLHHPHPNRLPKNNRHDTSGDETVARSLQGLSEEEIGDGGEYEIRQHGVKRHNAGVFCDVEIEIHC